MITAKKKKKLKSKELIEGFKKTPDEVVDYFKSLGIVISDNWKDTAIAIQNDAFAITGVKAMDDLINTKAIIEKAMSEDVPIKEFKEQIAKDLGVNLWRSSLIVSQNIANANAAGNYQKALDTAGFFPFLRPVVIMDKKTTQICQDLFRAPFVLRIDDTALKNFYHPRHFRCRTIWVPITENQRLRLGLEIKNGSDVPSNFWNSTEFRNLPNTPFKDKVDETKYPKDLLKQYKTKSI